MKIAPPHRLVARLQALFKPKPEPEPQPPDDCALCAEETVEHVRGSLRQLCLWLEARSDESTQAPTWPRGLSLCRAAPDCEGLGCQAAVCRTEHKETREEATRDLCASVSVEIMQDPELRAQLLQLALGWARRHAHLGDSFRCEFSPQVVHALIVANNLLYLPKWSQEEVQRSLVQGDFTAATGPSAESLREASTSSPGSDVTAGDLIIVHLLATALAGSDDKQLVRKPVPPPSRFEKWFKKRRLQAEREAREEERKELLVAHRTQLAALRRLNLLAKQPERLILAKPEHWAQLLMNTAGADGGAAVVDVALSRSARALRAPGQAREVARLGRTLLEKGTPDDAGVGLGAVLSAQLALDLVHAVTEPAREAGQDGGSAQRTARVDWASLTDREPIRSPRPAPDEAPPPGEESEAGFEDAMETQQTDSGGEAPEEVADPDAGVAAWFVALVQQAAALPAEHVTANWCGYTFTHRARELARLLWDTPRSKQPGDELFLVRTLYAILGRKAPKANGAGAVQLPTEAIGERVARIAAAHAAELAKDAGDQDTEGLVAALHEVRRLQDAPEELFRPRTATGSSEPVVHPNRAVDRPFEEFMRARLQNRLGLPPGSTPGGARPPRGGPPPGPAPVGARPPRPGPPAAPAAHASAAVAAEDSARAGPKRAAGAPFDPDNPFDEQDQADIASELAARRPRKSKKKRPKKKRPKKNRRAGRGKR